MNLVSDQVVQLQHVDVADNDVEIEGITSATIIELRFAVEAHPFKSRHLLGVLNEVHDLGLVDTVEDRSGDLQTERLGSDTEVSLKHLTHIHA